MRSYDKYSKSYAASFLGYEMFQWYFRLDWNCDHRIVDAGFDEQGSAWVRSYDANGRVAVLTEPRDARREKVLGAVRLEIRHVLAASQEGVVRPEDHAEVVTGEAIEELVCTPSLVKFQIGSRSYLTTAEEWARRHGGFLYAMRCR